MFIAKYNSTDLTHIKDQAQIMNLEVSVEF